MSRRLVPLFFLLALLAAPPALADGPAPDTPAAPGDAQPPAPAAPKAALVRGHRVNVRVGPRVDNHPVTQLEEGDVVIVLERRLDWVAIQLPSGFPAAVSTDYAVPEGPDMLRVKANKLNLRAYPPEPGKPAPGVFLDQVTSGTLLPLIEIIETPEPKEGEAMPVRSSGWAWVLAPESVRVFVHSDFLTELGPLADHQALVDAARAKRDLEIERLAKARRAEAARKSGLSLMGVLGTVQQDLYRLRIAGGHDKTPVVALANRLDRALQSASSASTDVLALARALREDLEREVQLRAARYDAELAKVRGLDAPAVPPLEKTEDDVNLVGEIRYEPTPGWTEKGIYLLWIEGKPRFLLRLGTGGPLPHPELSKHVKAGPRKCIGRRPGRRLFGLPVLEVVKLEMP